jgi:hypothetical protein
MVDAVLAEKFWSRVDIRGPDECWEWQGSRSKKGYGFVGSRALNKVEKYAHRFAYRAAKGPIPDGLVMCHKCDNPPCCNPAHLWPGTVAENAQDMVRKGRAPTMYAETNPMSNPEIRARMAETQRTSMRQAWARRKARENALISGAEVAHNAPNAHENVECCPTLSTTKCRQTKENAVEGA